MNQLVQRLGLEHRRLARLLDLLERLLDRFSAGTEPDYDLMCELLEYMEIYGDQIHHKSEDLIFDRLRAIGVEKTDILDVLAHQHALLGQMNRRFRRSLEGIIHEEVLRRDEVEMQGRELIAALRQHMDIEEREAFPLAIERLSADDWSELESVMPDTSDPLFVAPDTARFRALYQVLMEQATDP